MHDNFSQNTKKSDGAKESWLQIRLSDDMRAEYEQLAADRASRLGLTGRKASLTAFFFANIHLMIAYGKIIEGADLHPNDVAVLLKDPLFQGLIRTLFAQNQTPQQ